MSAAMERPPVPTSSEFPEHQDRSSFSPIDVADPLGSDHERRCFETAGARSDVAYIDDIALRWRQGRDDTIERLLGGAGLEPGGGMPLLPIEDTAGPELDRVVSRLIAALASDIDLRSPRLHRDRVGGRSFRGDDVRLVHELAAVIGYWTARQEWGAGRGHATIQTWLDGVERWIDGIAQPSGRVQAARLMCRSLTEQLAVDNARASNCPVALSVHARKVVVELRAVEFPPEPADRPVERLLDRILEEEWRSALDYHASVAWVADRLREVDQLLRPIDERPIDARQRHRLADPETGRRDPSDERELLAARIRRGLPHHQLAVRRLRATGDPFGAELAAQLQTIEAVLRWASPEVDDQHRPLALLAGQVEVAYFYPFWTRPVLRLDDGHHLALGGSDGPVPPVPPTASGGSPPPPDSRVLGGSGPAPTGPPAGPAAAGDPWAAVVPRPVPPSAGAGAGGAGGGAGGAGGGAGAGAGVGGGAEIDGLRLVIDAGPGSGSPALDRTHTTLEGFGIGSRNRATLRLTPDWEVRLVTAPDRVGVADQDLPIRPHYRLSVTVQITTGAVHLLRVGATEADWHRNTSEPGLVAPDDPRLRPRRRWWTGRDLETWSRRREPDAGREAILVMRRVPPAGDDRSGGGWRVAHRVDTLNQLAALLVDPVCRALGGEIDGATGADNAGRAVRPAPTMVLGAEDIAALDSSGGVIDPPPGLNALDLVGGAALDPRGSARATGLDDWLRFRPRLVRNLAAEVAPAGDLVLAGSDTITLVSPSSPARTHRERMEVAELAVVCRAVLTGLLDVPAPAQLGLARLIHERTTLTGVAAALGGTSHSARSEHHGLLVDLVWGIHAGKLDHEIAARIDSLDGHLVTLREAQRHRDARSLTLAVRALVVAVATMAGYSVAGGHSAGALPARLLALAASAGFAIALAGLATATRRWAAGPPVE
jgi:hypothetical protein